jgi:hypothetical protein
MRFCFCFLVQKVKDESFYTGAFAESRSVRGCKVYLSLSYRYTKIIGGEHFDQIQSLYSARIFMQL